MSPGFPHWPDHEAPGAQQLTDLLANWPHLGQWAIANVIGGFSCGFVVVIGVVVVVGVVVVGMV